MGMQPITGYNYGAGHYQRVRQTLRLGMTAAVIITTCGFAIGELFPRVFVGMFTTNDELTRQATVAVRFGVAAFAVVGAQIVITQFFQSIGKAKISIFLSPLAPAAVPSSGTCPAAPLPTDWTAYGSACPCPTFLPSSWRY